MAQSESIIILYLFFSTKNRPSPGRGLTIGYYDSTRIFSLGCYVERFVIPLNKRKESSACRTGYFTNAFGA
jgi:hypothetical protein